MQPKTLSLYPMSQIETTAALLRKTVINNYEIIIAVLLVSSAIIVVSIVNEKVKERKEAEVNYWMENA